MAELEPLRVAAAAQLDETAQTVTVLLGADATAEQTLEGRVLLTLQTPGQPAEGQQPAAAQPPQQLLFALPPAAAELTGPPVTFYYSLPEDESSDETPVADLAGLLATGTITEETQCWREGLPDWQPLAACTQLMTLAKMTTIVEGIGPASSVRRVVPHRGQAHLRAVYNSLDADGDGLISWAELSLAATHGLGVALSHADLDRLFAGAGGGKGAVGRVGFERFCELVEAQASGSPTAEPTAGPGWATVARRGSLALHTATAAAAAAAATPRSRAQADADLWSVLPVSSAAIE